MKDSTTPALLQNLFELLEAHRSIFKQERTFLRAVGLVFAELAVFARHTVTQQLLALGLTDADWSAWYRLFSRGRFDAEHAGKQLLAETLREVDASAPYVIGVDGVQVPRSSRKMPGTSWLKALGTAPFKPGIQRAQRFLNLSWLMPLEEGYSRAIPLKWFAAFPEKAVEAAEPSCREWQAGLQAIQWTRQQLDKHGRAAQKLLALVDGSFEKAAEFWKGLPHNTFVLGRSARNRALYEQPVRGHFGRPPIYGNRAPTPAAWLKQRDGWQTTQVAVRGHQHEMRYRIAGPYVRYDLPDHPVFLIVVHGIDRKVRGRRIKRDPVFYLVSAECRNGEWVLPFSIDSLLAWAWQRWELEVEHREIKSGFGLGQKQCWNKTAAVVSVQWSAWVYGVLLLAGYRTWGLLNGPACPGRWWRGSRRWSFNTLWRGYRAALWSTPDFRAVWTTTGDNWLKKGDWIAGLWNSVIGSTRC